MGYLLTGNRESRERRDFEMKEEAEKRDGELFKAKFGRVWCLISEQKWNDSQFINVEIFKWYKDKKTDEWKKSFRISIADVEDMLDAINAAIEYKNSPKDSTETVKADEPPAKPNFLDEDIPF